METHTAIFPSLQKGRDIKSASYYELMMVDLRMFFYFKRISSAWVRHKQAWPHREAFIKKKKKKQKCHKFVISGFKKLSLHSSSEWAEIPYLQDKLAA